jgi:hypothetical protein
MKLVKNTRLQSCTIFFSTEKGCDERWLKPGEGVVVPDHYITEQVLNLAKKRILKIVNA